MMPANKKASDLMGDDIVELSTENNASENKIGAYEGKWLEESKAKLIKQIDGEKRARLIMSKIKNQIKNIKEIAKYFYIELRESKFDNIVFKNDKVQDMNMNHSKLEIHDTYKRDEIITTNFEPIDDKYVINKGYVDEKVLKLNGLFSLFEKNYNEFSINYNKQSVEEIIIQRAVKTTIQILHDKKLFNGFPNAEKVLKDFLFVTKRRSDLEEVNDDAVH